MINIEYDWPIEKDHINIDDRMFFIRKDISKDNMTERNLAEKLRKRRNLYEEMSRMTWERNNLDCFS